MTKLCATKLTIILSRITIRYFIIAFNSLRTERTIMNWTMPSLITTSVASLLLIGLVPNNAANRSPQRTGLIATMLVGFAFLMSLIAAVQITVTGPIDATFAQVPWPIPFSLGLQVDSVAVVMMTMISFISLIIARYSITYLRDDFGQGRFFRWMSFTVGSTLLMVISRNLVMFTVAWMMTSYGLHQLLTHYSGRTWAIWAARKKFLISRLGDLMLVMAMILTFRAFGSLEYVDIFSGSDAIREGTNPLSGGVTWIGLLLVLGAMTKSAQFPFHSWLPDTMEAPTPVSALMHAGVINAGGFLMIRLSPLVTLSPVAMNLLTLIGTITAILGSVVMMTQSSVKRSLAYSTIAQMGFMMLQCGLGAYSSALLHIVAHSAYKAHAFLSCGSVVESADRFTRLTLRAWPSHRRLLATFGSAIVSAGIVLAVSQINLNITQGNILLKFVLFLAIAQLIWQGLASDLEGMPIRSIGQSMLVALTYATTYLICSAFMKGSMSYVGHATPTLSEFVIALVVIGFAGLFGLQLIIQHAADRNWIRPLYVHAMNGFYVDIPARRLTAFIYRQVAPVQ